LANIVYDQEDANVIYDTLNKRYVSGEEIGMPERVKAGVIHEDNDKVEDDLGDDELNAFYKGYTEEGEDKNSAFNKLKDNQINESDVNDYDFVGLNAELRKVMSPDEIDNHSSDLYVKKTAKSTEVLKRFNILGHPLCTTFIDNITHTPWYEVAFAYVPQEFLKDGSEELDESLLQDLQKDHEAIKDTYGQEVYKALDKYLELGFDLGDVLYKESEWNRFIKWAKKNGVSVNTPKSTLAFDDVNESIDEEPYTKEMVEQSKAL
jgi:hypothetical protein